MVNKAKQMASDCTWRMELNMKMPCTTHGYLVNQVPLISKSGHMLPRSNLFYLLKSTLKWCYLYTHLDPLCHSLWKEVFISPSCLCKCWGNELKRHKESWGQDLTLHCLYDFWALSWACCFEPIFLSSKARENCGRGNSFFLSYLLFPSLVMKIPIFS